MNKEHIKDILDFVDKVRNKFSYLFKLNIHSQFSIDQDIQRENNAQQDVPSPTMLEALRNFSLVQKAASFGRNANRTTNSGNSNSLSESLTEDLMQIVALGLLNGGSQEQKNNALHEAWAFSRLWSITPSGWKPYNENCGKRVRNNSDLMKGDPIPVLDENITVLENNEECVKIPVDEKNYAILRKNTLMRMRDLRKLPKEGETVRRNVVSLRTFDLFKESVYADAIKRIQAYLNMDLTDTKSRVKVSGGRVTQSQRRKPRNGNGKGEKKTPQSKKNKDDE